MSQTSQSPLDAHRDQIEAWIQERKTNPQIVASLARQGVKSSERSVRRALSRWGIERGPVDPEPATTSIKGDEGDITGKPSYNLNDPEGLMIERGLDPEEWDVVSATVNEWDGLHGESLKQLKIHIRRKVQLELLVPARTDGPTFSYGRDPVKGTRTVVFVGDQQAPYHDPQLHALFCNFLSDEVIHEGILIGDTADFPDISRHPDTPETDAAVQECIDSSYLVLRQYREANEEIRWQKLAGNHDERIRRYQIDKASRTYNIRRALIPGEKPETPVMDIEHLFRLDELGIEYLRPQGDYEHEQINVSKHLAARHGWIARKGSGASALATLQHLGYSVVVGHTHRQSLVFKTTHDINGQPQTLAACETGCMCLIRGGLGYAVTPDWQNGFATATIWPDGTFKIDLATYVDGVLYYRDRRYT